MLGLGIAETGSMELPAVLPRMSPAALDQAAARLRSIRAKTVPISEVVAEEGRIHLSRSVVWLRSADFREDVMSPRTWWNGATWGSSTNPGLGASKFLEHLSRNLFN
jgi:hypothetical protein